MTAAQKENIKRFKAVQAEAKKLKAKNKKLTHQEAVKQAWAIMYSKQRKAAPKKAAKKVGAVKKKAAPKKKTAVRNYGSHKDTHSHNVKISVMSGTVGKHFKNYKIYKKHIIDTEVTPGGKKWFIASGGLINVPFYTDSLTIAKKYIDRVIALEKTK